MGDFQKGVWINPSEFVTFAEAKAPRKALLGDVATRARAGGFLGYGMELPNPDEVLRNLGQDITAYNRLLIDAHVGACVISRKAGTRSMSWNIERGKAPARAERFVADLFTDLDVKGAIESILQAPLFGYQALEVTWSGSSGSLVPTRVEGKPQSWFSFDAENQLRFKSMNNPMGEELPPMKFLLARHDATYENPYGFPLLSRCFWPVAFKKGGYKFWVTFVEKYGGAFAIGKHPRGTGQEEVDKLADMLEAMIQSAIAVIPDDSSVEIKESSGKAASTDGFERLCLFSDAQVSKALLGQTLTTEVGKTGGAFAASETHMQVRSEIVDGDADLVSATFNTLIRWVTDLNFGPETPAPTFSLWREEDKTQKAALLKEKADRDQKLAATGQIRFTQQYFEREYEFQPGDVIVIEKAEAPAVTPAASPGTPPEFADPGPDPVRRLTASGPLMRSFMDLARGKAFPDQASLDKAMAGLMDLEQIQAAGVKLLQPFIALVREGATPDQVMEQLVKAYPEVNLDDLTRLLEQAIFAAEVWGRLHAGG